MKIVPLKFGIALGSAFGILFFISNVLLSLVSNEITLQLMKIIFHEMDFKPLMIDNSFHILHLVCGIGILFVVGGLTGYLTAIIYNAASKQKIIIQPVPFLLNRQEETETEETEPEQPQHNPIGFTHK